MTVAVYDHTHGAVCQASWLPQVAIEICHRLTRITKLEMPAHYDACNGIKMRKRQRRPGSEWQGKQGAEMHRR